MEDRDETALRNEGESNEMKAAGDVEEAPPVLGTWRNMYWLVLGCLAGWIILFTLFTWWFR